MIEKERLAVIREIEKFRKYRFGAEILLKTNHKPLSFMKSAKVLNPRIIRWTMKLQPNRFKIIAICGQDNSDADYLSMQFFRSQLHLYIALLSAVTVSWQRKSGFYFLKRGLCYDTEQSDHTTLYSLFRKRGPFCTA